MADVIEAEGLEKVFPGKKGQAATRALAGVTLAARAGEMTALIGPDGAGKTTLMRLVCGLMAPTAGRLTVCGLDVTRTPQAVQDQLSYMPQKFGLYEDLTVAENMELYADLCGVPDAVREERFAHLLHMTGLAAFTGRLAGKLSGGMKQKLGLACTLVRSPRLLLLDEPTVGVDPLSRRELWEILTQLVREEQLSVLVSTAYMEEAARCAHVYVLHRGRLLAHGTPEEIRAHAAGLCYEAAAPTGMPLRQLQHALLAAPDVLDAVPAGGVVRFLTRGAPGEIAPLRALGVRPAAAEARLEDGFMTLLREAQTRREDEAREGAALSFFGTGTAAQGEHVSSAGVLPVEAPSGAGNASGENAAPEAEANDAMAAAGRGPAPAVLAAAAGTEPPVEIEVEDLVKKFGDFTAVAHTSFSVRRGEVFGLLGPNGAGKTTTFRMLCGLLPATSGVLRVAGVDLRTARTQARANIGYVAQKFSLYSGLTVYENLRFFGGAYGLSGRRLRERIAAVAEEFHLEARMDEAAGRLPGGYKQRLSMAAALIHAPGILFLDEPTSGIDPLARRTFWQEITRLAAGGTTIVITTHFMEEAEYCDRFMIQDHGKMLVLGSPAEIRARLGREGAPMDEVFIAIVEQARREKEGT